MTLKQNLDKNHDVQRVVKIARTFHAATPKFIRIKEVIILPPFRLKLLV